MAQQDLIIGTANAKAGDTLFDAFTKTQSNFDELYEASLNPLSMVVNVCSLDDLPDPVSGVISLASDTVYLFCASVDFGTNRVEAGSNTVIAGAGSLAIVLTYTGTSVFITSNDNPFAVRELTIVAQATGATVFDYSATSLKIARFDDITAVCYKFASFSGTDWAARLTNVSIFPFASGAITCAGTCRSFNYNTAGVIAGSGVFLDLGTCVFDSGVVRTIVGEFPSGTTFISGLTGSGNVSANGRFFVEGCQIDVSGGGTALSGVTENDARFDFSHNTPIKDSRSDFLISFGGNTTNNTVIAAAGTYVKVNSGGTWVEDADVPPSGYTTDSTGTVTYVGVEDLRTPADVSISMEPASGTNKDLAVKVAINGIVKGTAIPRRTDAGSPGAIAFPWQLELSNGDELEVWVANLTDTTNILVGACIFRGD